MQNFWSQGCQINKSVHPLNFFLAFTWVSLFLKWGSCIAEDGLLPPKDLIVIYVKPENQILKNGGLPSAFLLPYGLFCWQFFGHLELFNSFLFILGSSVLFFVLQNRKCSSIFLSSVALYLECPFNKFCGLGLLVCISLDLLFVRQNLNSH